ncbi:MAG: hypothetical protein KGI38_11780 [Thaumarchaeota archaeon]|nr:hypothetical protein [Nitrososphaerota archaeon]
MKWPESEGAQSAIMLTVLIVTILGVGALTTDPTLQKVLAGGFYIGFISFIILKGEVVKRQAGERLHLGEEVYVPDPQTGKVQDVANPMETMINRRVLLGVYPQREAGRRDLYIYKDYVEPHEEEFMPEFGKMAEHFRIMPDREDKFQHFQPRKNAARWKGEGPFNHGHSDFSISILSSISYMQNGVKIPIHFQVWGSKVVRHIMQDWDSELEMLSRANLQGIIDTVILNEQNGKALTTYDATKIQEATQK